MTSVVTIHIAKDFSDAPGARYRDDGPDSGQEFYLKLLKVKFEEAINAKTKLSINLDGTYGYATSFISESFGNLSKEYGAESVLANIILISDEDKNLISYILKTIKDPDNV